MGERNMQARLLSSEINYFRVPTLSNCGEGNISNDVNGESLLDATESKNQGMHEDS